MMYDSDEDAVPSANKYQKKYYPDVCPDQVINLGRLLYDVTEGVNGDPDKFKHGKVLTWWKVKNDAPCQEYEEVDSRFDFEFYFKKLATIKTSKDAFHKTRMVHREIRYGNFSNVRKEVLQYIDLLCAMDDIMPVEIQNIILFKIFNLQYGFCMVVCPKMELKNEKPRIAMSIFTPISILLDFLSKETKNKYSFLYFMRTSNGLKHRPGQARIDDNIKNLRLLDVIPLHQHWALYGDLLDKTQKVLISPELSKSEEEMLFDSLLQDNS